MQVKIKTYRKKREIRRIHLLLFIFLSFSLFIFLTFLHKEKPLFEKEKDAAQQEVSFVLPPLEEKKEVIRRGMTLTEILKPYNLNFLPGISIFMLIFAAATRSKSYSRRNISTANLSATKIF